MAERNELLQTARTFSLEWIRGRQAAGFEIGNEDATPEKALRWWACYKTAEQMHECNTIKDWGYVVESGMTPFDDDDELEFFNFYFMDADETTFYDDWQEQLTFLLKSFFGNEHLEDEQ